MKGRGKLLFSLLSLLLVVLITAPLWVLPVVGAILPGNSHENDYTAAIVDKYDRLNGVKGKKIVFVGGSSLPFGLKCELIESELPGYTAVDFGLYASLGTVEMMDLSLSGISEGDIVILAPETDPQLYSDFFTPRLFRTAIGDRTDLLASLSPARRRKTALAYYPVLFDRLRERNDLPVPDSETYARSSLNEYGDMALTRKRNQMPDGFDASKTVTLNVLLDRGFFDEVNAYAKKVREKGATLLFWFPPINEAAVRFSDKEATRFAKELADALDCPILGDVRDTVYEPGYFYDTNYHLNDDGAVMHTATTIKKIKDYLGLDPTVAFYVPPAPEYGYSGEITTDGTFLFQGPSSDGEAYALYGVEDGVRAALTDVTVPATYNGLPVRDILSECFMGCKNMTSLTIPESVIALGSDVFVGCGKLTVIKLEGTSPFGLPDEDAFKGASPSLKIYYPRTAGNAYTGGYTWPNYQSLLAPYDH